MMRKLFFILLFCNSFTSIISLNITQHAFLKTPDLRRNLKIDIVDPFIDELKANHSSQLSILNYFINNGICQHFYWDMGTNIGIQLRKLYEPQHYPNAPVLPFFAKWFGPENPAGKTRDNVCAIGFEPGHIHVPRLLALQDAYQKAGYPLIILTSTAVWNVNGQLTFYDDIMSKKVHNEWGSSLIQYNKQMEAHPTLSVDIDALIHHVMYNWDKENYPNYNLNHDLKKDSFAYHNDDFLARHLPHFHTSIHNKHTSHHSQPAGSPQSLSLHSGKHYFNPTTSKMIAKVDIEGAEFTILPHMALHGSICFFDEMMIEWHPGFVTKDVAKDVGEFMNMLHKEVKNCRFHIDNLDDETYGNGEDTRPFPSPLVHHGNASFDFSASTPVLRRRMDEGNEPVYYRDLQKRRIDKNVKFIRLIRLGK
jgi:hypothetical protein